MFGVFGETLEQAKKTEFFIWFRLAETAKEIHSGNTVVSFRPTSPQFRPLVCVQMTSGADQRLRLTALLIQRAFIDHSESSQFAADITKSFLVATLDEADLEMVADAAMEIRQYQPAGSRMQTMTFGGGGPTAGAPGEGEPEYLTYAGKPAAPGEAAGEHATGDGERAGGRGRTSDGDDLQKVMSRGPLDQLSEYEIRHLAAHLLETKELGTLHRLLALEDADHGNAWFVAKSRQGDDASYLADVQGAWAAVEDADRASASAEQPCGGLPLQVRYAFIEAALADMAVQPSGMVVAFVRHGHWTDEQAVAYAGRITYWDSQLKTVTALAQTVDGEPRRWCEKRVLEMIVKGPAEMPSRTSVGGGSGEWALSQYMLAAECLDRLAATLPESLLEDAVAAGQSMGNWFWRIAALKTLAARLPAERRSAVRKDLSDKAAVLERAFLRAEALANVAPLFEGTERETKVGEAIHAAVAVLDDWEARKIMQSEPRSGILTLVHDVQKQMQEEVRPLRAIAPHATEAQLRTALEQSKGLGGLPRHEALLVLLPELARRGNGPEALLASDQAQHPVYRMMIRAAIAPYLADSQKKAVLDEAHAAFTGLEEPEVRSFCLAEICIYFDPARRMGVLRSIIADAGSLKEDSLRADVLMRVAKALGETSETGRGQLAREAYKLGLGTHGWERDALLSALTPALESSEIEKEFRDLWRIPLSVRLDTLQREWTARRAAVRQRRERGTTPRIDMLTATLAAAESLKDNQKSRLLVLAAPILSGDQWEKAVAVGRSIDGPYLKASAQWALAKAAPEDKRPAIALEAIGTICDVAGGMEGAAPLLEELVPIAATAFRPDVLDVYRSFLHSLTRSSVVTMAGYLAPTGAFLRVLGGDDSLKESVEYLEPLKHWWGKDTAQDGPEAEKAERPGGRFQIRDSPASTAPEAVAAMIGLFLESGEFDAAKQLLQSFGEYAAASGDADAELKEASDAVVAGLAGAGKLDEASAVARSMKALSPEVLDIVVRRLISYGRLQEARAIFEATHTDQGAGVALPLASVLVESLVAEDNLSEASSMFESLKPGAHGEGLESYVDMVFMLANAQLRRGDAKAANQIAARLIRRGKSRSLIAARLDEHAAGVRDANRKRFWTEFVRQLD